MTTSASRCVAGRIHRHRNVAAMTDTSRSDTQLSAASALHTYWLRRWIVVPSAATRTRLEAARYLERSLVLSEAEESRAAKWPHPWVRA